MKKVVSFSLFGDNTIYLKGLEANLKLAEEHYSDWEIRVYTDSRNFLKSKGRFEQRNVQIVEYKSSFNNQGLFERFRPMFDADVDIWISRDLDSRISSREAAAVNEWLETELILHVMRDSHNHSYPVMAGMFGMRKINKLHQIQIQRKLRKYFGSEMTLDQTFLSETVWKKYKSSCLIHDHWKNRTVEHLPLDSELEDGVTVSEAYGVGLAEFLNFTREKRHPEIFPKTAVIRNFPKNADDHEPLYVGQIVLPGEIPAYSKAMRWEYELRGKRIPSDFQIR